MLNKQPLREAYDQAFDEEKAQKYPLVDDFERRMGYAVDQARLEHAARILACPLKVNPPNWQHGRVIYATLRRYLSQHTDEYVNLVDIGTAKGFSALIMSWALKDARVMGKIYSVDVIDPSARQLRNTVADCDGEKTLYEILQPFPESRSISFAQKTGTMLLSENGRRVNFAFVDGKHKYDAVKLESRLLLSRQEVGDITIFDDLQIPGVGKAVEELTGYDKEYFATNAHRSYCIAARE